MPFFNFGSGTFFGRIFSAALEVVCYFIGWVIIVWVVELLGLSLPEQLSGLVMIALALYFLARVFFVGPRA